MDHQSLTTTMSPLLRADEVAQRLNISRSLAYQLMQRGEIPTVRFGGSVRVRESDLGAYVQRSWSGWKQE